MARLLFLVLPLEGGDQLADARVQRGVVGEGVQAGVGLLVRLDGGRAGGRGRGAGAVVIVLVQAALVVRFSQIVQLGL